MRDINKINERISNMSGREPDKNLDKGWADWLTTVHCVLDIDDEKKKAQPKQKYKS